MRPFICFLALALSVLVFASQASADANYGSFSAGSFSFTNVSETDVQTPGPNPPYLFGTPTLYMNALEFGSTGFNVSASGSVGTESQNGQLSLDMVSNTPSNGFGNLSYVEINEGGTWSFNNGGPSTSISAEINVVGIYVTAINGTNLLSPILIPGGSLATMKTTAGSVSGTLLGNNLTLYPAQSGSSAGTWNITTTFGVGVYLQDTLDITGTATSLALSLGDVLTSATDEPNASDDVSKSYLDVVDGPSIAPEPSSLALLAAAGVFSSRRRRHTRENWRPRSLRWTSGY